MVDVDRDLGTTLVRRIVAAHDVGRAINPMLVEGQIHGGIAQGLGFALMEEYVAGRTDNLHDYLIPTIGDVPPIETILVEDAEPAGPFGAKGVGEPALIPTAPAILGAIRHATGIRIDEVPATPDRVRSAILRGGLRGFEGFDRKPFGFLYIGDVDDVFRALADPTRRALLDALTERDGQTLLSLAEGHGMTRVGVAKHLRVLEDAGLVVAKRRGREKHHYLNAVPIRLIHDRWINKYTEPWAAGLTGLKRELELPMEKVFEIYIRTTPERLWEAITDPATHAKYHFGGAPDLTGSKAPDTSGPPRIRGPARRGREPRRRPAAEARPSR